MKILFYLEPHFIRESSTQFTWIAKEIVKMYENEFLLKKHNKSQHRLKMLVSRHVNNVLRNDLPVSSFKNLLLGIESKDNDFIDQNYNIKWDEEAIDCWKDLLTGQGSITNFYVTLLEKAYREYPFDLIVYWGTNGAVKKFSNTYSIPSISMELGPTRNPFFETLYFDFIGVNGNAYTNQVDLEEFESLYSIDEIQSILPISMPNEKELDAMFNVLDIDISNMIYGNLGKNVLIPLQLLDDTNIILYTKYQSMFEFLSDVLPKLLEKGYICYIKPHPGNVYREINKLDHEKCENFCQKQDSVYWLDNFDNANNLLNLYSKMDYIVVLNSSVGFENMLLKNVVIPLGKSPYNIDKNLPTLDDLLNETINLELYEETITKIVNMLLFNYLYFRRDFMSFDNFINAIEYNIYLNDMFKKNSDKFKEQIRMKQIKSIVSYLNYK
ncbi:MAG TPA: hypothetical protein ENK66_01450 [Arcobacter sp.]|nr:hypothetical protein [Arcobacter sp.]